MPNSINYFKYFPTITYNNKSAVNITRRTKIIEQLYSMPLSFFSYTVKEDERPEDISLYYYDDIGKVWLIFLANNIIDPASEWPLSQRDFNNMIIEKYRIQSNKNTNNAIFNWTYDTTITQNILYYENAEGLQLTKDTYDLNNSLNLITTSDWNPVRILEHEFRLNEEKRKIFLFNKLYASQAESELKELLSV